MLFERDQKPEEAGYSRNEHAYCAVSRNQDISWHEPVSRRLFLLLDVAGKCSGVFHCLVELFVDDFGH